MKIDEHYKQIASTMLDVIDQGFNDDETCDLFSDNHCVLHHHKVWLDILKDLPESEIFINAVRNYQIALHLAISGLYQQAYMGLRYYLERMVTGVFFSATEIELRTWLNGGRDTYWTEVANTEDKDIFSRKFCNAFFPELVEDIVHFKELTKKVYRECSEYVHGNPSTIRSFDGDITYSEKEFVLWNRRATTINRIVMFVLTMRYLCFLSDDSLVKLKDFLPDYFKTINVINEKFDNING